jgi:hypothetical protein
MSVPTLTVRIGFESDPFDNPQTWTDVTRDAMAIHIARGRQHALDRVEAGTATVILNNTQNQYWPDNTGSPYTGNIKPGKCINIRATYGGSTYDSFYGFIESWQPSWATEGGKCPITTLECADLIKNLARYELPLTGYAAQLSGIRIDAVLDDIGWPVALMDLDAGQSTMAATGAFSVGTNAIDHIFSVCDSERGQFFITGAGVATFHDRHARFVSPYTVSQATFGDDAPENIYRMIEPSYDDEFIYNTVIIQRTGGSAQTATDSTSATTYGKRSLSSTGLFMSTDADALSCAQYLLAQYKDASLRTRRLVIYPQRDEANLFPKVLGYDIGTRITLRLNQASLDKDYHIEGNTHDYDSRDGLWATTWQLSDADNAAYWTVGVAGLSEVGETTKLIY